MERILITGGSGFVGSYVCKECEKRGLDYRCIDLSQGKNDKIIAVDLLDYESIEKTILDYQPTVIIHLAAISSPVHGNVAEIYRINICGTENIFVAASKLENKCRIVLISTAGVYGNQQRDYLDESLLYNPVNHYSCSKMVTEIMSRQYAEKTDIVIVRPFNIIGAGQKESFFIPKLVKCFKDRHEELVVGNLEPVRDYVSVEFCAMVLVDLATSTENVPDIINICTGKGYSCREVIEIMQELTGYCPKIKHADDLTRKNEVWHLVGDKTRIDEFVNGKYKSDGLKEILYSMLNV